MSVRVVARIRPLLKNEIDRDVIVTAAHSHTRSKDAQSHTSSKDARAQLVRIPNPKNGAENFSFQFNSVYEMETTQQELFENEISPTVKHLFNGFDVTLFAYGVTGTGKTHTMRGGKSLADRGVIPRLLSAIYRRTRKIEKDTGGATTVEVAMSYYEIYNDRVFDLFEPPEKRTTAGLPIRDNHGKTVVVGLSERPCTTLKEFEQLYDQANINRSTSATKLNAHSSRSHAVLCVKLTQTTDDQVLVSTASAIDLAGSEDNRRTDNNRERLVESSAINKSLFVLAQCVEAISKNQSRIPYRESKMTRILALGQNNGMTVMILNLAPVRSYHQDTLSSLNFANRTKKIEVNEIENEPMFKGVVMPKATTSLAGPTLTRQPLRPLTALANSKIHRQEQNDQQKKPVKTFPVYQDRSKPIPAGSVRQCTSVKRGHDSSFTSCSKSSKVARPAQDALTKAQIEAMIDRRVDEKIAEQALSQRIEKTEALPADLQIRLDALEQRVAEKEDSEGLHFLLMAKQHSARGEDASALRMYQLAQPFFPSNSKLARKMDSLREKMGRRQRAQQQTEIRRVEDPPRTCDGTRHGDAAAAEEEDDSFIFRPKTKAPRPRLPVFNDDAAVGESAGQAPSSPRSRHLLDIINTRDVGRIRALRGVGCKKAEAIVAGLLRSDEPLVTDLAQLAGLRGVGAKTVENMRVGLALAE